MPRFEVAGRNSIVKYLREILDQLEKRSVGQVEVHGQLMIEDCDRLLQRWPTAQSSGYACQQSGVEPEIISDVRTRVTRAVQFACVDDWQAAKAELDEALILRGAP